MKICETYFSHIYIFILSLVIKNNLLTKFSEWIFLNATTTIKRVIQGALICYYSRSAYFFVNFLRLRFFFFRWGGFFLRFFRLPRLCRFRRLFGCWFACKEELDGNFLLDNRGQCQTFDCSSVRWCYSR